MQLAVRRSISLQVIANSSQPSELQQRYSEALKLSKERVSEAKSRVLRKLWKQRQRAQKVLLRFVSPIMCNILLIINGGFRLQSL